MANIFISYSHDDKNFAKDLSDRLISDGVDVWFDEGEMLVGDSLFDKIETGIEKCEYLGVILSPSSVDSDWVRKEVNMALAQEGKDKPKVLPLLYKACSIPGRIADRLYADFTADIDKGYSDLLARLTLDVYAKEHEDKGDVWIKQIHNRAKRMSHILKKAKILIVNDYPRTMKTTMDFLIPYGVEIFTATTTEEALDLMQNKSFDAVVSDMRRGSIDIEGQLFLEKTIRMGIHAPTIFTVAVFEADRGVPPYAFGITKFHEEAVHLVFDVLERRQGWNTYH